MKEIGEKLKEARLNIGITIEEAAEDLKLRPSQIENIEEGNQEAFKDIFYLKYFIRDYAKYLGLNKEDMVDEFNEYLFDYTSKISLNDIKSAKKKLDHKKGEKRTIVSPYTMEQKEKLTIPNWLIYILIVILLIVIGYFVYSIIESQEKKPNAVVSNLVK